MSRAQRVLAALAVALALGILRWACVARITHDEGYMLDAIAHFPDLHVMQVIYNGVWGNRWVVTTGPTVSLPLGLLAYVIGVPVVFERLWVYAGVIALFVLSCRLARVKARTALAAAALFLLWVLCMVWRPDTNGSSINLLANVFGEGIAFGFALAANLLSVEDSARRRRWTWVCAVLAVGAKTVALLAVVAPCLELVLRARRRGSPYELAPDGLALAAAIVLGWNGYLLAVLGWHQYAGDWRGLIFWLGHGGGYNATQGLISLLRKVDQLEESHVSPWVVLLLTILPGAIFAWLWKTRRLLAGALLRRRQVLMLLASIGIYYFWYVFLAGRGWMRHLWIGYALLGWLVSMLLAQLLETERRFWPLGAGFASVLFAVSVLHGTLPALGPLGPTERWETQRELAQYLSATYPYSRLMVIDWHMVPHIAFFMQRPQNDAHEIQPVPGDLFLCDLESVCVAEIWDKYCKPRITNARVAFCLYQPEAGKK